MSSSTKALDPAFQGVGQRPYPIQNKQLHTRKFVSCMCYNFYLVEWSCECVTFLGEIC